MGCKSCSQSWVVLAAIIIVAVCGGWFLGQSGKDGPTLAEYYQGIQDQWEVDESIYTEDERRQRYDKSLVEYNRLLEQRNDLIARGDPDWADLESWYAEYRQAQDITEGYSEYDAETRRQSKNKITNLQKNRPDACRGIFAQEVHELNTEIDKTFKQLERRYNDLEQTDRPSRRQAWVDLRNHHIGLSQSDPALDQLDRMICVDLDRY